MRLRAPCSTHLGEQMNHVCRLRKVLDVDIATELGCSCRDLSTIEHADKS